MLVSMTGFGRGIVPMSSGPVEVIVRAVNSRYLQTAFRLPVPLAHMESALRDRLQKAQIQRGRIDVTATIGGSDNLGTAIQINEDVIGQYLTALAATQKKYGLSAPVDALSLLQLPGVVTIAPVLLATAEYEQALLEAFAAAIAQFRGFRNREGQALTADIRARLALLRSGYQELAAISNQLTQRIHDRLKARLAALLNGEPLEPSRLEQEVALLSDRADITEEMVRIATHLDQAQQLLEQSEPAGRMLEFVVQELFREISTLGVKIGEADSIRPMLLFKAELERIREQAQNVE